MQFISFCLFTLICGYSLVISAPINQTTPDSQETKQQKATVIAHRLLQELAGEQVASPHIIQSSNNEENKDAVVPVNHPPTEKVQSHIENQLTVDDDSSDDDNEDLELTPTIDELYEIYSNKYAQIPDDDEESSFESLADDDYLLPVDEQQLMNYLAEQEEGDEHPALHTPVMDDSIMTAENYRQRRSVY